MKTRFDLSGKKVPFFWGIFFCLMLLFLFPLVRAESFPRVMFIFDASGSMWGDAAGQKKIDAAKEVMNQVVPGLPSEVKVSLTTYGHRVKGDCADIEILMPPGNTDRDALLKKVRVLDPKGKTPIADSIKMVANRLKGLEDETTIILISDGEETCNDDPCGVVKELKESGIKFILHVVGFGVDDMQKKQLSCLAEAGGGTYFGASDAAGLLFAMDTVGKEVARKVEKAKAVTQKKSTKLGKLRITLPEDSRKCLKKLMIIRVSDGKLLKTIESPKADSTHPLLTGTYEITAGYTNSNYKPDSEVSFGTIEIHGGETTLLAMGSLAVNMADSLADIPAGGVVITKKDGHAFELITPYTGNDYYFYKTKPLPPGTYDFGIHYQRSYLYRTSDTPVLLAKDIEIQKGKQSVVTIDSGIQLKKPEGSGVTSWQLLPVEQSDPVLQIVHASNGDYPLWHPYAVMPGTYNILITPEGMDAPLPVGEGITIKNGELIQFDTGF